MKKLISLLLSLIAFVSCANQAARQRPTGDAAAKSNSSFYDFKMAELETGKLVDFHQYKGKKVVLLNVASKCGYTPQYADWEAFYKEHGDKVEVLGFPANNFGSQEPGSNDEIASFCSKNYGVTFPMSEKIEVNGDKAHPLYQYLVKAKPGLLGSEAIKWNFTKFLVDKQGNVVKRYAPTDTPDKIAKDIEGLLA